MLSGRQLGAAYADPVNAAAEKFAINTPPRMACFLAQVGCESEALTHLCENLNYSAVALLEKFHDHFDASEIGRYARNPRAIANRIYASRMGNGDEASGDGWLYRGRGLLDITGRYEYGICGTAIGTDLIAAPDLLLEPKYAALSAAWFWSSHGLNLLADVGNFTEITRRINGGTIGLADRLIYLRRAKEVLGVTG